MICPVLNMFLPVPDLIRDLLAEEAPDHVRGAMFLNLEGAPC